MYAVTIPVTVYLERKLRDGIRRAKLVCHGHEDTKECRIAWDQVEDIQRGLRKAKSKASRDAQSQSKDGSLSRDPSLSQCEFDELACREYDV